jgi:uncharacterized membrane protein
LDFGGQKLMARWLNFLVILRGELWLIPAVMGVFAIGMAVALVHVEISWLDPEADGMWWLYSGTAGTALDLLSTLLGGLITMMTLVISVTFVTLILAASQLGPRLILNFMGDHAIQAVIGLFLASILYSITVLRSLDGTDDVPHLAVTVGSLLAVLCLAALLFYVHKIARAIISDTVVQRVGTDLQNAIIWELPEGRDDESKRARSSNNADLPKLEDISVERSGYVQAVEYSQIVDLAKRNGLFLRVNIRAGHFVIPGNAHVEIFGEKALSADEKCNLLSAIVVGPGRSPAQDLEFSIRQLVEVALRALSPGINDPFTAIAVLDQLGAGLALAMARQLPPTDFFDGEGVLRVSANRFDIHGLAETAFDQIRQSAEGKPDFLIYLADTIRRITKCAATPVAKDALKEQLRRLKETVERGGITPADQEAVAARIGDAVAGLS